ncbi:MULTISPECIES: hypothetical protein [unclassified Actinotalea]|uniref:hypothetical protein n=1 Tax=unclassified Actinotalea TaxID=2638618 RepID=UPI0015F5B657|nr:MULTISPECIES: hypothetical protein [unclassified Actinotalea]
MRIELPLDEVLTLATTQGVVPPFVHGLRADGETLRLRVDAAEVMGRSGGLGRLLGGLAGEVPITARFTGWADGVVTLAVTAESRGIPLHRFMPLVENKIRERLRAAGLPDGVVEVRTGPSDPVIAVDTRRLLAAKVAGVVVTDVRVHDATLHVAAVLDPEVPFRLL